MHRGIELRKVFDKTKGSFTNVINHDDGANFPAVDSVFTAILECLITCCTCAHAWCYL